jgi:pimeloyl-ACP methyl ester carboxylesterase
MEQLDLAPAHVVGLSFGGSIALRLAARRPDLFHSLSVHEPPLLGLLAGDPVHRSTTQAVFDRITAAAARLAAGDAEGGARQFVETVALGPGAWDQVPPTVRQTFVRNAATFLDETRDPKAFTLDLTELAAFPRPALLTRGDRSPAWFAPIVARLAAVLPRAETRVFAGAGHPIVLTHPAAYAAAITDHAQAADEMARAEPLRLAR